MEPKQETENQQTPVELVTDNGETKTESTPKMSALLKEGWQFVQDRKDLLGWYIVLLVVFSVLSSEWLLEMNNIYTFVSAITAFVVLIFIMINSWAIMYTVAQPDVRVVSYKQAFDWSAKHFFPLLWTSILVGLATLVGFALLIIPGLMASIYLQFSIYAVAMGTPYGTPALKQSYQDVKGRWWQVFGKLMILGLWLFLLYLVVALVFGLAFVASEENGLTAMVSEALFSGVGGVIGVLGTYAVAQYYKYLRSNPISKQHQIVDKKSTA